MRVFLYVVGLAVLYAFAAPQTPAQGKSGRDSTGLPGDQFSLQGALEMFKQASSPEEFEKLLNTQDNHVNNLDLNGDGDVDYVRVMGKRERNVHVFVLQVPVSETESQDIAVIELEKTGSDNAILQIVGDEDIFGEQVIVEPRGEGESEQEEEAEEVDVKAEEGNKGPYAPAPFAYTPLVPRVVVNVWMWPCVRFVYAPTYVVWVSPWRWHVYPSWWHPWRPLAWHVFHPFRARYHAGFVVARTHRVVHAHRIYRPARVTSVSVTARHRDSVNRYRVTKTTRVRTRGGEGRVKTTRTTTKVTRKRR